jgi:hypothetical protein
MLSAYAVEHKKFDGGKDRKGIYYGIRCYSVSGDLPLDNFPSPEIEIRVLPILERKRIRELLATDTGKALIQQPEDLKRKEKPMNYWDEVKRIRNAVRADSGWSISLEQASKIIDGITEKYGYYFRVDSIFRAVPIAEIEGMIAGLKKRGGNKALYAAAMEEVYKDAGSFVNGDKLEGAEITARKTELEQVIRQLEIEVDEYLGVCCASRIKSQKIAD